MTEIERKALAWVNEVEENRGWARSVTVDRHFSSLSEALCRAIERIEELEATEHDCQGCGYAEPLMESQEKHEAFRQEVSDAVEAYSEYLGSRIAFNQYLQRFIIPKPDPLVAVAREMTLLDGVVRTANQKAAIREGRAGNTATNDFYDRLRAALAARGLEIREVQ